MTLQEATKEANAQMNQADYLLEMCAGVYNTGLSKPYATKYDMLKLLLREAQRAAELQAKIDSGELVKVVHDENVSKFNPVDRFECSECGIILEGYTQVIIDDHDMDESNREYEFEICPNCGARMENADVLD